jgi:hypothetical protein
MPKTNSMAPNTIAMIPTIAIGRIISPTHAGSNRGQQRWLERCPFNSPNALTYSRRRTMAVELAGETSGFPVCGSRWKPVLINSLTDRGVGNALSTGRPAFLASAS